MTQEGGFFFAWDSRSRTSRRTVYREEIIVDGGGWQIVITLYSTIQYVLPILVVTKKVDNL